MTKNNQNKLSKNHRVSTSILRGIVCVLGLVGLIVLSDWNFQFFQYLIALFLIASSWSIFLYVWNTRKGVLSDALVFIGLSYAFVGLFDLMHLLISEGVRLFLLSPDPGYSTQFWIIARLLESLCLLTFAFLVNRNFSRVSSLLSLSCVSVLAILSGFFGNVFSDVYTLGQGRNSYIVSINYLIELFLVLTVVVLFRKRKNCDKRLFWLMITAVVINFASALVFDYAVVFVSFSYSVGYFLKLASVLIIYYAIITTSDDSHHEERQNKESNITDSNEFMVISPDILQKVDQPLKNPQEIHFTDIFKIEDIQKLQDQFSEATGVASIITDTEGVPLTKPSNFCRLCNEIIRKTEKGLQNCYRSDALLGQNNQNGPSVQPCLSGGLWDAGAGITVGGRHIANWLIGQVRDETQTEHRMREYAREIGADEKAFLEAFHEVPILPRERFQQIAQVLFTVAQQLSSKAYQNLQQSIIIAEKEQTEKELKKAQKMARIGYWEYDIENKQIWGSEEAFRIYGIERTSESIDLSEVESHIPESQREYVNQSLVDLIEKNKKYDLEFQINSPGKQSATFVHSMADLVLDSTGKPIRVEGVIQDITTRKQTELELVESEKRFKALHNASFGGIAIHDMGLILECNNGLSELTGYTYEELIGMDGLQLISENTRELVLEKIKSGYEKPYEAEGVKKNGEIYPLRLEARQIPYKGKIIRVVEFRDLTETKKSDSEKKLLENQLIQAQKMEAVGRLAGGVAHDFNNMLSVILGYTDLLLEQIDSTFPYFEALTEIKSAGDRSSDLTRQLLAFARKQTVEPEVLDINQIIQGMTNMLKRLIGEEINIVFNSCDAVWPTKIDPAQLDQILINLCVNAKDAIQGPGQVIIETENTVFGHDVQREHPNFLPGEYVMLSVSDSGCGISEQTLNKIFEPFFTTKEEGKGTGLGLSMVYGAVKQNDGFVRVESEIDEGTTFKIFFPRYKENEIISISENHIKSTTSGHETILLVEDESAILKMASLILKRLGYDVVTADHPYKALEIARNHSESIHLLLTDVIMPEMNGREMAKQIVALHPEIKCLYMSGYTSDVIADHGILEEGVNFISKPFTLEKLGLKVREVLDAE